METMVFVYNFKQRISALKMKFDNFLKRQLPTKHKPRHEESKIQQAVVLWFRLQYPKYIIAAVPNGGFRNAREAAIMQREGVLAGFADLVVIAQRNVLFLEMKTTKGKQSDKQKEFQNKVSKLGFEYIVCRSFEQARLAIERWLKVIEIK
nr:MAG TPA: Nuclease [Caudoviricetes sp.]